MTVVCGTDLKMPAEPGAMAAAALCSRLGDGALVLVHVLEKGSPELAARARLGELGARLELRFGIHVESGIEHGEPGEVLVAEAEKGKPLVAELVAGEIGRALGLLVPDLVYVDLDIRIADAEPDPEIQIPLRRSAGLNVGLDFLPGALGFDPATGFRPSRELAADIIWFDSFVTNVDREPRNPNMLVWHKRLWLIDHGSALYVHHTWRDPGEHAVRPFTQIKNHVLMPYAGSIEEANERLAARVTPDLLESAVGLIPDVWLPPEKGLPDSSALRAAYLDYLTRRLAAAPIWVEEAERARRPS